MLSTGAVLSVLLAILIGYLLGSVPVATLVSRRRGVDIFTTGTGLAGAANVFRSVGHGHGAVVFLGDAAKGVLTVFIAHRLGVDGTLVLLPAAAALAGHWRSVFNGFRGGDGLSTLLGVTLASLPVLSPPISAVAIVTAGVARLTGHHASTWAGGVGYALLLAVAPFFQDRLAIIVGIELLALLVLAHGVVGYRRRRWEPELDEFADDAQPENSTT